MKTEHLKCPGDFGRLSLLKSFGADGNTAVQIPNLRCAAPL